MTSSWVQVEEGQNRFETTTELVAVNTANVVDRMYKVVIQPWHSMQRHVSAYKRHLKPPSNTSSEIWHTHSSRNFLVLFTSSFLPGWIQTELCNGTFITSQTMLFPRRRVTLSHRVYLRTWLQILFAVLALVIFHLINERKHPFVHHAHAITTTSIEFAAAQNYPLLDQNLASPFCKAHLFKPYTSPRPRKIYDLFLLNTEIDWLFIRLHTLFSSVDYFIVVESPITFTGHPKPLILKENWEKFSEFHAKIIYHVLEDAPKNAKRTWDIEDFQRNAMFNQVVPKLDGAKRAEKGDILVVSDVDEIPRPATMILLRNCDVPKRVTIRSQFYYYGFQWRQKGEQWAHGQATIYNGPNTILPTDLRNGEGEWNRLNRWWEKTNIWNAGWHCSSCFSSVEAVLGKLASFSHVGMNQEYFRDRDRIVEKVREGKDLWNRKGIEFDRVEDNQDIPEILKLEKERFRYMIHRDAPNAGFEDYNPQ